MKCLVLHSFAGPYYSAAKGKEIDLPLNEAKSLEYSGVVKILENSEPETAFETAAAAMRGAKKAVKK